MLIWRSVDALVIMETLERFRAGRLVRLGWQVVDQGGVGRHGSCQDFGKGKVREGFRLKDRFVVKVFYLSPTKFLPFSNP
jgi:hypothetical protein